MCDLKEKFWTVKLEGEVLSSLFVVVLGFWNGEKELAGSNLREIRRVPD